MGTMLEKYTTKERNSLVHFLWAKGLNAKDIHKEMFPVYSGKCLSCKAVHNSIEKFSQKVQKWLRQQSKTPMLQVSTHWQSNGPSASMLVEDISRNKCFFQVQISHVLPFYPFVTYLMILSHMKVNLII
jgi:hypothetical protein